VYIYHTALRLGLPIKGTGLPEGLEIFPRQDELGEGESGNTIRAPLGVHRGARESRGWPVWFYGADYTLRDQLGYLSRTQKVSAAQLAGFIAGKTLPDEFVQHSKRPEAPRHYFSSPAKEFRILDYVQVQSQMGRNWIGRCPSCATANRDRSGDNLTISVEEPRKYICWAAAPRR
jgi:hypothetical protein